MKSSLYTRTGDAGQTSLVGGTRVGKDNARLEAYGSIDELNSHLGLLTASTALDRTDRTTLRTVQHRLFDVGTMLATEPESRWQPGPMDAGCIEAIEAEIDRLDEALPRHRRFILPCGHPDAGRWHAAPSAAWWPWLLRASKWTLWPCALSTGSAIIFSHSPAPSTCATAWKKCSGSLLPKPAGSIAGRQQQMAAS